MPAEPVTREDFAALVTDLRGELTGVTEERRAQLFKVPRRAVPAAWRGRNWAREYAGIAVVMDLTALSRNSVRLFDSQARGARQKGELTVTYNFGGRPHLRRLMPPSDKEKDGDEENTRRRRRWMLGELALWVAAREDRQATPSSSGRLRDSRADLIGKVEMIYERDGLVTAAGITAELGLKPGGRLAAQLIHDAGLTSAAPTAHSATPEQILDAARQAVSVHGANTGAAQVTAALHKAGVRAERRRIPPFLARARLERIRAAMLPTEGNRGAELESLRSDGLVTAAQIARAYGVGPGAVSRAWQLGNLKVAKWDGERRLYDPARLTVRADGGTGPVDVDSEHAAKINPE